MSLEETVEKEVVSLELSKKLEKAGYSKDKSIWYWYLPEEVVINKDDAESDFSFEDCVAAPTVAELGRKLPEYIITKDGGGHEGIFSLHITKSKYGWSINYVDSEYKIPTHHKENSLYSHCADTEADARAKMWLYLKKNNLLKKK